MAALSRSRGRLFAPSIPLAAILISRVDRKNIRRLPWETTSLPESRGHGEKAAGFALVVSGTGLLVAGIAFNFVASNTIPSSEAISPASGVLLKALAVAGSANARWEFIIKGALLTICGFLVLFAWNMLQSMGRRTTFWLWAAVFVLIIAWTPVGISGHSARFAGSLYSWLCDDAMISMRYAHNFASGLGLVWNPGERVEGYSNFLWTLYMAGIHLLGVPTSKTSFMVIFTNIALAALAIPVLVSLVHVMGGGALVLFFSLGSYVLSKHIAYWATEGVETPLLTLLVLLGTYRVLRESGSGEAKLSTYLIIAAASLVRADGFVLSGLLYAVSFALNRDRKHVLIYSVISIVLPVAHLVFRLLYYGDFLPNTAYLKVFYWDQRYALGAKYVVQFSARFVPLFVMALIGCLISRDKARIAVMAVVMGCLGYVAIIGGDAFPAFRFLVPAEPLLIVCGFLAVQDLPLKSPYKAASAVLCVVSMPLIVSPTYAELLTPRSRDLGNVQRALLIKANTLPTAKVADTGVGTTFYFSERPGIDFLGKVDQHIARLSARCPTSEPGHNKFDFDYSLGVLKPDVVVCKYNLYEFHVMNPPVEPDCMPADAILYRHPLFRKHCLPNTVDLEQASTIFICDWSSEKDRREKWKDLHE